MRSCRELLEYLEEQCPNEYDFLIEKCYETDPNGCRNFFVGVRNGRLSLYYKAMRVFELTEKDGKTVYSTNKYYANESTGKTYVEMSFLEMKGKFKTILNQIENHVYGKHDSYVRREKICQQWIINSTNQSDSNWYYLDLEYIDDDNPYGRPDMIAISRYANAYGKHDVVFVELKVRRNSYSGLDRKAYKENEEKYLELRKDLFNETKELKELKYGSGIVSHIADFLRYLYHPNSFKIHMREEILEMIYIHRHLGLIKKDDPLHQISKIDDISEKPRICIVSYTYVPTISGDRDKKVSIKSLKTSFYNYLFNSEFSLENMLNPEQITGFLRKKELLGEFKNNDKDSFNLVEFVAEEPYEFQIIFVDPDKRINAFECL